MNRYLLYVSYIGTQFRGVQKLIKHNEPDKLDSTTVQGLIEIGLQKLRPLNTLKVTVSSRTDAGVHAIQSTFHVDLLRRNNEAYKPDNITICLNKYFNYEKQFIRIIKTVQVPNNFHCRYDVNSRTYVYKLALIKHSFINQVDDTHLCYIPIGEYGRCHFLSTNNFQWDKVIDTCKLFSGLYDFRTFMGRGSHYLDKVTRRNLEITLEKETETFCKSMKIDKFMNLTSVEYDYWCLIFTSRGFLYNQVRRVVGTLIAVGQNKLTPREVQFMLQIPSRLSWNPRVVPAPAHGLYLRQVNYSSHDLKTFK